MLSRENNQGFESMPAVTLNKLVALVLFLMFRGKSCKIIGWNDFLKLDVC